MRRDERDELLTLDWSKVYANVPDAVDDGVRVAFLRIRERRRRRARTLRLTACAACLLVLVGAAAMALRGGESAPDRVVPLAPESIRLNDDSEVYASRDDARYHVRPECPQAGDEVVSLKLITAKEFEKTLCPVCGGNVLADGY